MKKIISFIVIGVLLGGLGTYGVVRYMAVQRVEDEIAGFVEKTPAFEKINYGKVRVGIIRSTVHLENIQIKLAEYKEPILIDQIDLVVRQRGHSIPPRARAEIRGVHLNTRHGLFQALGADLKAMGYDDITGLIALDYHYDSTEKRLDLNDVALQADGMGRLQFELALTNLDLSRLVAQEGPTNAISLLMVLPTMGIARGRFTYRDDSFAQRLVRFSAQRSGQKQSDDWHKSLTKLAKTLGEEKNERIRQIISVLREFIDHPESITVTMNPTKSVPLLRFLWVKKPVDLIELLNVHVTI